MNAVPELPVALERPARNHPRCTVALPAQFTPDGERVLDGTITSLSGGGMFLRTPSLMPINQRVAVRFGLGHDEPCTTLGATVAYHNLRTGADVVAGMGMRFWDAAVAVKARIETLIDAYPGPLRLDSSGCVAWVHTSDDEEILDDGVLRLWSVVDGDWRMLDADLPEAPRGPGAAEGSLVRYRRLLHGLIGELQSDTGAGVQLYFGGRRLGGPYGLPSLALAGLLERSAQADLDVHEPPDGDDGRARTGSAVATMCVDALALEMALIGWLATCDWSLDQSSAMSSGDLVVLQHAAADVFAGIDRIAHAARAAGANGDRLRLIEVLACNGQVVGPFLERLVHGVRSVAAVYAGPSAWRSVPVLDAEILDWLRERRPERPKGSTVRTKTWNLGSGGVPRRPARSRAESSAAPAPDRAVRGWLAAGLAGFAGLGLAAFLALALIDSPARDATKLDWSIVGGSDRFVESSDGVEVEVTSWPKSDPDWLPRICKVASSRGLRSLTVRHGRRPVAIWRDGTIRRFDP